jgi:hypothetical protein
MASALGAGDLGQDIACLLGEEAACCGTSLKMLRSYLSQGCFVSSGRPAFGAALILRTGWRGRQLRLR